MFNRLLCRANYDNIQIPCSKCHCLLLYFCFKEFLSLQNGLLVNIYTKNCDTDEISRNILIQPSVSRILNFIEFEIASTVVIRAQGLNLLFNDDLLNLSSIFLNDLIILTQKLNAGLRWLQGEGIK